MIYQIKIETNSEEDWLRLRGIFDSPLTHPMCFPYFYESKAINAWSRQIKINRDEEFVKEKNRHRSEAKIDAVEVAKFIDNHSTDSEAIDMITSLMNGEYTVQAMRQDFLESDGSIYFGSKETQGGVGADLEPPLKSSPAKGFFSNLRDRVLNLTKSIV